MKTLKQWLLALSFMLAMNGWSAPVTTVYTGSIPRTNTLATSNLVEVVIQRPGTAGTGTNGLVRLITVADFITVLGTNGLAAAADFARLNGTNVWTGTNTFTLPVYVLTPTVSSNAATMQYVDDSVAAVGGGTTNAVSTIWSNNNAIVTGARSIDFVEGGVITFTIVSNANGKATLTFTANPTNFDSITVTNFAIVPYPTATNHAANKLYVDTLDLTKVSTNESRGVELAQVQATNLTVKGTLIATNISAGPGGTNRIYIHPTALQVGFHRFPTSTFALDVLGTGNFSSDLTVGNDLNYHGRVWFTASGGSGAFEVAGSGGAQAYLRLPNTASTYTHFTPHPNGGLQLRSGSSTVHSNFFGLYLGSNDVNHVMLNTTNLGQFAITHGADPNHTNRISGAMFDITGISNWLYAATYDAAGNRFRPIKNLTNITGTVESDGSLSLTASAGGDVNLRQLGSANLTNIDSTVSATTHPLCLVPTGVGNFPSGAMIGYANKWWEYGYFSNVVSYGDANIGGGWLLAALLPNATNSVKNFANDQDNTASNNIIAQIASSNYLTSAGSAYNPLVNSNYFILNATGLGTNTLGAATNYLVLCENSSSTNTVILPASPTKGQEVVVKHWAGSWSESSVVIEGNGKFIGNQTSLTMTNFEESVTLIYDSTNTLWHVISHVNPSTTAAAGGGATNAISTVGVNTTNFITGATALMLNSGSTNLVLTGETNNGLATITINPSGLVGTGEVYTATEFTNAVIGIGSARYQGTNANLTALQANAVTAYVQTNHSSAGLQFSGPMQITNKVTMLGASELNGTVSIPNTASSTRWDISHDSNTPTLQIDRVGTGGTGNTTFRHIYGGSTNVAMTINQHGSSAANKAVTAYGNFTVGGTTEIQGAMTYKNTALSPDASGTNYVLDFSMPSMTITMTNHVHFIQSTNRVGSATLSAYADVTIQNSGTAYNVSFSSSWKRIGAAPAATCTNIMQIAAMNKFGTSETNVIYGVSNTP